MEEATFVGWLKKPGEAVKAGDPLFTLENEKAAQDVESTDSGRLRLAPDAPRAGDVVKVGALLGYLDTENESGDKQETEAKRREAGVGCQVSGVRCQETAVSSQQSEVGSDLTPESCHLTPVSSRATAARASHPAISPRARRRARELGMDWSRLQGSGRTGRIVEADVLEAAKKATPSPLSTMRRLIAQRTAESFATVPHFYLRTEVDVTALLQLRERLLPDIERTTGARLTLTDLILRAQARALRECPFANAIWQDNHLTPLPAGDVGLVVGLPDGLMIPIVRSADGAELAALVKQRAALVEAARAGRLANEALQGGATSLSNLGNTCVDEFSAVIPPPHSSILAVGRAVPRPFVVREQLVLRPTLKLCLSVDHRVMDGGPAAEFLGRIVAALEQPQELIGREDLSDL
jgi:pyruvate dehydrogenase E2 component (dihydrolipoamide acetyltransferase)